MRVVRTFLYAAANKGVIKRGLCYVSFALSSILPRVRSRRAAGRGDRHLAAVSRHALGLGPVAFEECAARDGDSRSLARFHRRRRGQHRDLSARSRAERHGALHLPAVRPRDLRHPLVRSPPARARRTTRGLHFKRSRSVGVLAPRGSRGRPRALRLGRGLRGVVRRDTGHGPRTRHGPRGGRDPARSQRRRCSGSSARAPAAPPSRPKPGAAGSTTSGSRGRFRARSIPDVLAASDAALVLLRPDPLFETVLPSKMFEAMAAACPVILGVRGESRALLDESGGGIGIEPGSGTALARGVLELAGAIRRRRRSRAHSAAPT